MSPDTLSTLTLTDAERVQIAECLHFAMRFMDALGCSDKDLLGMQFLKTTVLGDIDHATTGKIV